MRREEELSRRSGGGQPHATTKMNVTIVLTKIIVNSNNRSSLELDAYTFQILISYSYDYRCDASRYHRCISSRHVCCCVAIAPVDCCVVLFRFVHPPRPRFQIHPMCCEYDWQNEKFSINGISASPDIVVQLLRGLIVVLFLFCTSSPFRIFKSIVHPLFDVS